MKIIEEKMNDIFTKYHIQGLPFNAVIHHFSEKDKNEHIHDHPWSFTSHVIKGSYIERIYEIINGRIEITDVLRREGTSHFVPATLIHEILDFPKGQCTTIVLPQPWQRETHFWKFEDGVAYSRKWNESEFKKVKL